MHCEKTIVLTSWPSLISGVLVDYNFASDWPRIFYTRGVLFCIVLSYRPTMAPAEESCHVKNKGRKASYFCVRLPGCMHV